MALKAPGSVQQAEFLIFSTGPEAAHAHIQCMGVPEQMDFHKNKISSQAKVVNELFWCPSPISVKHKYFYDDNQVPARASMRFRDGKK